MRLTLTIENQTSLPDGGPLSFTVEGSRGFDIGRDPYLDWTLPDPTRFVSGKHCEIRPQDGEYLLYDVSRTRPEELADTLGQIMRLVTGEMMQLLSARSEARRMTRSASQTVVQALDNNPLKFSPSPEEALAILLGPPTRSYLDAQRALKAGFSDLKSHQVRTYAAMQQAARRLGEDFAPQTIEANLPAEGGLGAVIGGRRARLWDTYVARWSASAERHDDGLADVFMQYFAECYDRG